VGWMLTRVRSTLQVMQIGAAIMSNAFPVLVVEARAIYRGPRRHRL